MTLGERVDRECPQRCLICDQIISVRYDWPVCPACPLTRPARRPTPSAALADGCGDPASSRFPILQLKTERRNHEYYRCSPGSTQEWRRTCPGDCSGQESPSPRPIHASALTRRSSKSFQGTSGSTASCSRSWCGPLPDGKAARYELVAGARRYRASKTAGRESIPA